MDRHKRPEKVEEQGITFGVKAAVVAVMLMEVFAALALTPRKAAATAATIATISAKATMATTADNSNPCDHGQGNPCENPNSKL